MTWGRRVHGLQTYEAVSCQRRAAQQERGEQKARLRKVKTRHRVEGQLKGRKT